MSRRSEDHQQAAEAAGALADACSKMEECYKAMTKAAGGGAAGSDGEMYSKIASQWGTMAKVHSASNEYHLGACTSTKAAEAEMEKAVRPDLIRSVYFADVQPGFGIRAVARTGAPDTAIDKAKVPIQFRHLISGDDDENL